MFETAQQRGGGEVVVLKTDYLPDLSEKFQALSLDVSIGSNAVREKALKTEFALRSTLGQLMSLEEELQEGSEEVDEIHGEQAELLKESQASVSEISNSLSESLEKFNAVYDETTVRGFKASLINDAADREVVLERLNASLTDLEKNVQSSTKLWMNSINSEFPALSRISN